MQQKQNSQQPKDFGDFQEIEETREKDTSQSQEEVQGILRVRMPRGKELIGIIAQRFGGNKMEVKATDGKIRNCRVPGKYKKKLWLRPGDVVILVPWEYDNNKGDIIYKYPSAGANQLRKQGILSRLGEEF